MRRERTTREWEGRTFRHFLFSLSKSLPFFFYLISVCLLRSLARVLRFNVLSIRSLILLSRSFFLFVDLRICFNFITVLFRLLSFGVGSGFAASKCGFGAIDNGGCWASYAWTGPRFALIWFRLTLIINSLSLMCADLVEDLSDSWLRCAKCFVVKLLIWKLINNDAIDAGFWLSVWILVCN